MSRNKSPFILFLDKMKRLDPSLRSKHISSLTGQLNPIYNRLSPEVAEQFRSLSTRIRTESLDSFRINKLLDAIHIDANGVSTTTTAAAVADDSQSWDEMPDKAMADASARSGRYFTPEGPPIKAEAVGGQRVDTGFNYGHQSSSSSVSLATTADGYPSRASAVSVAVVLGGDDGAYDSDEDYEDVDLEDVLSPVVQLATDWKSMTIVCICFNVMVRDDADNYYPNEVGLTRFTLARGVHTQAYHRFVAVDCPRGLYATARQFSDASHKIPVDTKGMANVCTDYQLMANEIYDFMAESSLHSADGRKIVFCKTTDARTGVSDRPQTIGSLKWLDKQWATQSAEQGISLAKDFMIYDISELLFLMARECCERPRPKALCADDMSSCKYEYRSELFCEYHRELDVSMCALAVTQRSAYLFIESVLKLDMKSTCKVELGKGHIPPESPIASTMAFAQLPTFRANACFYGNRAASAVTRFVANQPPVVAVDEDTEPAPSPIITPRTGIGRAILFRK